MGLVLWSVRLSLPPMGRVKAESSKAWKGTKDGGYLSL